MIPVSTFSKRVGNKLEHLLYPFDCNYYSYLLLEANVANLDFTATYNGNMLYHPFLVAKKLNYKIDIVLIKL